MRVLVAEDDASSRKILAKMLEQWDYQVIAVENGQAAMEVFQSPNPPILAMLDWEMPGMSGIDVCRQLRQRDGDRPTYIILLTMRTDEEDMVTGLRAGADDYVTKPFNRDELHARIAAGRRIVELQDALSMRISELETATAQVQALQGFIPICVYCHRIRDAQEDWLRIEKYVATHAGAQFSGGICPECAEEQYPGVLDRGEDEARVS